MSHVHYNISKKQRKVSDVILKIMAHEATGKDEAVPVHVVKAYRGPGHIAP